MKQVPRSGASTRPARPKKSNGQWKVDGQEPLNKNEIDKAADNGLNVRTRIEEVYSKGGFASIDPDDLHGRFRWWGLYTQRKPGIDGGRTAKLEPHELEDEYFMMRIRTDGGALNLEQLRTIAEIAEEFARGSADLTDRQNIQLHWIEIENVPEIWRRLEAVGMQTTEACGDVPRGFLGSPVAGIAADELIDPTPAIEEITRRYIGDPSLSNLPRKYKTAITGHPSQDVVHEINDCSFVAVDHPEHGIGYDLWVGGALSVVPRFAERLGAWVAPDQVVDVWLGVTEIFRDYGYRRLRNKARMKFLLADWGPEKLRDVLETEYLGYRLADGPPPPKPMVSGDHVGVHRQKDGKYFIGTSLVAGRASGTLFHQMADLIEEYGIDRIRLTPMQKILVLDVDETDLDDVVARLDALGLSSRKDLFRRSVMACTGIEYCKLAIVETKQTAIDAVTRLEERLADIDLPHPISLHLNGCPNSCARIQTADIGLKGQIVTTDEGEQVPGFQVHVGGGLASKDRDEAGLGRTVRGLKVTVDGLEEYVEKMVRRFLDGRSESETFSEWAHRVEDEELV
ncbi:nitrite/sulfite reductase [Brevibacterium aurantiacum]|uniref:assimilatory sulfite reductase (ferredoxin) n=1 Tax=Brevibacterium aurantiacum TaxID=273384 RepID=A0A368M7L6_BREAU|nr:nitrite/sulfite reductase [Brevibacterium aurantiacum]MDN5549446.1 nitrite/sulfite reductase [Brevibacterium sp.]AZL07545.1 nitrite/sulfite reductase [Brevibacterium aurantiacum]AZL11135.1 nitrite/sulfite reductase [Brevibacterium aurantiacum]AZL14727.1 nitrite/sulfite reductase [Brevibacterium aurantiacum]AZT95310.1 nitrite/sulfite reductase [Brevibacterium aurantiacum]